MRPSTILTSGAVSSGRHDPRARARGRDDECEIAARDGGPMHDRDPQRPSRSDTLHRGRILPVYPRRPPGPRARRSRRGARSASDPAVPMPSTRRQSPTRSVATPVPGRALRAERSGVPGAGTATGPAAPRMASRSAKRRHAARPGVANGCGGAPRIRRSAQPKAASVASTTPHEASERRISAPSSTGGSARGGRRDAPRVRVAELRLIGTRAGEVVPRAFRRLQALERTARTRGLLEGRRGQRAFPIRAARNRPPRARSALRVRADRRGGRRGPSSPRRRSPAGAPQRGRAEFAPLRRAAPFDARPPRARARERVRARPDARVLRGAGWRGGPENEIGTSRPDRRTHA